MRTVLKTKTTKLLLSLASFVMAFITVSAFSFDTFAAEGNLVGEGTSESPYQIEDAEDWDAFAEVVLNAGGAEIHAKLMNDIGSEEAPIETMIGVAKENDNDTHVPFTGVFDGQNHTITMSINSTEKFSALFSCIRNATIKDLKLDGNLTGNQHSAALVGKIYNPPVDGNSSVNVDGSINTIQGIYCNVDVRLSNNVSSGNGHYGGVIGHAKTSKDTFKDIIFTGSLEGNKGGYVGGIIGWADVVSYNIDNLFFNGEYTGSAGFNPIGSANSKPDVSFENKTNLFYINTEGNTISDSNKLPFATSDIFPVFVEDPSQFCSKELLWDEEYYVERKLEILNISDSYSYPGESGDAIILTPDIRYGGQMLDPSDYEISYTMDGEAVTEIKNYGKYDITVSGKGETYFGSTTRSFTVLADLRTDSTGNVYLVADIPELYRIAYDVASGNSFSGKTVKLEKNIGSMDQPVNFSIGASLSKPFSGTFDGNGRKIYLNIDENREFSGLFGCVKNATLKNLKISGSVLGGKYNGALAGYLSESNTVDNIICDASVGYNQGIVISNEQTNLGGLVGYTSSYTNYFKNILYSGMIIANSKTHSNIGGIVGVFSSGSICYFENVLFDGEVRHYSGGTSPSYKFHPIASRYSGNYTVHFSDVYYINSESAKPRGSVDYHISDNSNPAKVVQCDIPSKDLYREYKAIDGKTYYVAAAAVIENVENTYVYDGNVVQIDPIVKYNGGSMVKDTDYSLSIIKNGIEVEDIKDIGKYYIQIEGKGIYKGKTSIIVSVLKSSLDGSGTEEDPYLIQSDFDWECFADKLNQGKIDFEGKYIKLTEDIDLADTTIIVGTNEHPFNGIFDGDNHTITYNITGSTGGEALFGVIRNATIRNLKLEGSVSGGLHCASLVGFADISSSGSGSGLAENTISNIDCDVDVSLSEEFLDGIFNGAYSHHGGLIGHTKDSKTTLNDCIYSGTIKGDQRSIGSGYVGGLIAWGDYPNITMNNCIFKGSFENPGKLKFHPIGCKDQTATVNITDVYFISSAATNISGNDNKILADGKMVYTSDPALHKKVTAVDGVEYLTGEAVITLDKTYILSGDSLDINPVVKIDGNSLSTEDYDTSIYKIINPDTREQLDSITESGTYVIVATGKRDYAGSTDSDTFEVIEELPGQGTEDDPYTIGSIADWETFAAQCKRGNTYKNKIIELTADIGDESSPITTMVENTANAAFEGTLNGKDHSIYISYGSAVNRIDHDNAAPIYYGKNAVINDLVIKGRIYTSKKFAAGLFSRAYENTKINRCGSEVIIYSSTVGDGTHGGFIGVTETNAAVSITDSYFTGSMLGSATNQCGGFVGYAYRKVTFKNCLFDPGTMTISEKNSASLTRVNTASSNYKPSITNCYYITPFGDNEMDWVQGTQAYKVVSDKFCVKTKVASKTIYAPVSLTIDFPSDTYDVNDANDLNVIVKNNNTTLVKETDYVLKFKNSDSGIEVSRITEPGNYSVTIVGIDNYAGEKESSETIKVISVLSGSGTKADPYLIQNKDEWNVIAGKVKAGNTNSNKYFKLMADLDGIDTPIGILDGSYFPFSGNFDGNDHIITLNMNDSDEGLAAFGCIKNATIENLKLEGTVLGGLHSASLVGYADNSETPVAVNVIRNIYSNVDVKLNEAYLASTAKNGHHGGIVGHGKNSDTTLSNCVYSGTIYGPGSVGKSGHLGGLWGWSDSAKLTMKNCIFTGTFAEVGNMLVNPVCKMNAAGTTSFNQVYYLDDDSYTVTMLHSVYKGITVYASEQSDLCKKITAADGNDYYKIISSEVTAENLMPYYELSDSMDIAPTIKHTDADMGTETTFTDADYSIQYIKKDSTEAVDAITETGEYAIQITGKGDYAGKKSFETKFKVIKPINGTGTEEDPIKISDPEDLIAVSERSKAGETFEGMVFDITTDIGSESEPVDYMIGTTSAPFMGTILGNGHTIYIGIDNTGSVAEERVGFIRSASGATIKDLTLDGYINTSKNKIGVFIGITNSPGATIENCVSNVTVDSSISGDGTIGGFVGVNGMETGEGKLVIKNSSFTGKLLGPNTTSSAGFVGYSRLELVCENCIFDPAELTLKETSSKTFARLNQGAKITLTDCYYIDKLGDAQGQLAYKALTEEKTIYKILKFAGDITAYEYQGVAFSDYTRTLNFMNAEYTVTPTLKFGETELVAGTDFEYQDNVIKDVGSYKIKMAGIGNYGGVETVEVEIISHVHPEGELAANVTEAKEADCENAGNSKYYYCPVCDKYYSDELGENEIEKDSWIIEAKEHDWGEWEVTTPATETEEGVETRVCKNDPEHIETRVIEKLQPVQPTEVPTEQPTEAPTEQPTETPTEQPTETPTEQPTEAPTEQPKTEAGIGTISADGKILTDEDGVQYYVNELLTADQIVNNILVADKTSGGKYKITKITKKAGKITGGTVTYMAPYNKNSTKITIPATVKIAGVKYKVTAINKNAFKGCSKLTKLTIGKNVTKIGSKACNGCKKLKNIIIKSSKIKKIQSKAFKGINSKAKFKVPKKKLKKYKKMIKKAGAPKKAKVTK
ncbi:MAG: leucine-rich repeat protein [Eubacterium sp.]|nr:leucine-rich repeat protein [Eubacterium sp.]